MVTSCVFMPSLFCFAFDKVGEGKLSFSFLSKLILAEGVHKPHTTSTIINTLVSIKTWSQLDYRVLRTLPLEYFYWSLDPKTCRYLFMFSLYPDIWVNFSLRMFSHDNLFFSELVTHFYAVSLIF